jgi:diketogulonate reductase-like aldo/keto reductase
MELRLLGAGNRRVSVIGQGTWYIDSGDRGKAIEALRLGLDFGMTHIDTAQRCTGTPKQSSARRLQGDAMRFFWYQKLSRKMLP